jgi:DNA ligase-1
MLAGTHTDVAKLIFPLLASQKLDGLRATVQGGVLLSRSLKPLPNKYVQELFGKLPEGLDGELVVGNPFAPDAFRKTTSLVMSDDKPLDFFGDEELVYHVFDKFGSEGFQTRLYAADALVIAAQDRGLPVKTVKHALLHTIEELNAFEASMLDKGAEGVMVRTPGGLYKQGRATEKSGDLVKVKRFIDFECEVIGTFEMEHNGNEATINELGRTKRSSHKENKTGMGVLGGLEVRGIGGDYDGVEFNVGTGFNAATRVALWEERENLVGRIAKIKLFPSGSKDKPRHPVWLGWRSRLDI